MKDCSLSFGNCGVELTAWIGFGDNVASVEQAADGTPWLSSSGALRMGLVGGRVY
jgi:hypothetical protein